MDGLPLNGLDLAVGIVLLISALLAFMRGFVHEVLSIAAWVGAVLASIYGAALAQPFARGIIPIAWAADAVSAVIIFLVVLFGLSMITHAMAKTIQASALNNLDRILGFVFGIARAMVILGVGFLLMNWLVDTPEERPDWMKNAKTLPLIEMTAEGIVALIPDTLLAVEGAANVAGEAVQKVEQAVQAKEAVEGMAEQMKNGENDAAPKDGEPAYTDQERDALDALIEDAGSTE